MRTTILGSIILTALATISIGTACSKPTPAATVPAAPEFDAPDTAVAVPPTPASDGERVIAPEDQIGFAFDSADLGPSSRAVLDEVATWLTSNPARSILVQGHADKSGPAEYNLDLSARRARAVGAYLEQHGVAAGQIVMAAVGETAPPAQPGAINRRVMIYATAIEAASR